MDKNRTPSRESAITWVVWLTIAGFMLATVALISVELGRAPWNVPWLTDGSISDEVWRAVEAVRYRWAAAMLIALNSMLYLGRRANNAASLPAAPATDPASLSEDSEGVDPGQSQLVLTSDLQTGSPDALSSRDAGNKGAPLNALSRESRDENVMANADAQIQIATDEIARLRRELGSCKQELDIANQAKAQFLSNMSHELRTPMNGIVGMTDLLLGGELNSRDERFVSSISASATTLLAIINDLLDFSKIESGTLQLEHARFSVRDCVEDVCVSLAGSAHEKNVELICYVDENVSPTMEGDPTRVRQILNNLVNNAIAFTDEGEVVVRLTCKESNGGKSTYQCDVQDTGVGISPELQMQLFEAFTQADGSSTRGHGGLGMGLAIASQLVSMMQGEIFFRSRLGEGSRFSFTVKLEDVVDEQAPEARRRTLQGARVLVVDDNETNRTILYHQLSNWGLIVQSVEGGAQALEALRQAHEQDQQFDMLVLDLHMPEMDGIQLARAIQAEPDFSHLHSIMLTSAILQLDSAELQKLGIYKYVGKPARQSVLHDSLASLMPFVGGKASLSEEVKSAITDDVSRVHARVLLVEDNAVNQDVATGILEQLGCEVIIACDGVDAVSKSSMERFDIVFMDCQMPTMDGYEATRLMKASTSINARTPIIAITANAMEGERLKCLQAGMDDYISKPVRTQVLSHILKKWVVRPVEPFDESTHSKTQALLTTGEREGDLSEEFFESNDPCPSELIDNEISGHASNDTSDDAGVINVKAINTIRGLQRPGKPDLLAKVIGVYFDKTPELINTMQSALANDDFKQISASAHSLKSSSAYLGADTMCAKCLQLESNIANGVHDELKVLVAGIAADYELAAAALSMLARESDQAA